MRLCWACAIFLAWTGRLSAQSPAMSQPSVIWPTSYLQDKEGSKEGKNGSDDMEPGKEGKRKHIRDNGFLVEEAFNQEPGEVQHIFNWINLWDRTRLGQTRDFNFAYTMELPLGSQKHQFSFTAQFLTGVEKPDNEPAAQQGGVGDTFLNYRYQLLADDDFLWCAPRASLILPTADKRFGLGLGEVGYQFGIPVSRYGEVFDFHFNATYTITPGVSLPVETQPGAPQQFSPRRDLQAYSVGASVFWKPKHDLHFFVESLAVWGEEIDGLGLRDRSTQLFVNPGLRFAIIQDPVEWVLGVSAPIGLTRDTPQIGVFAYMSIEYSFRKKKNGEAD